MALVLLGLLVVASSSASAPSSRARARGIAQGGAAGRVETRGDVVQADPMPDGRLVPGSYEHDFGGRAQQHAAQDMPAPAGTHVFAPVTGRVLESGRSYPGQAGVKIRSDADGLEHKLGHLAASSVRVVPGERVAAGALVGALNAIAWSPPRSRADIGDLSRWHRSAPHLHYAIRDPRVTPDPGNRAVGTINPYPYLRRLRGLA